MNKALNVRNILDNLQTFSDELYKFSELSDSVIIGNTTNVYGFNVTSTLNQNTDINSLPTTVYATPTQSDSTLAKETPTVPVTTESMATTVLPVTVTPSNSPVITSSTPPLLKVNALCLNHTQSILGGLFGGKKWAMQMLDALGKPPAGLLGGQFAWLGDYDECIGFLGKLLLSFSVYTNGAKILSTNHGSGTLTAVNGIRFISMSWVILGHTYAFGLYSVGNIGTLYGALLKRKTFMAIGNAEVSVDTFFALSGTLLTYVVLNQLKKQKGKLNWFMFYFHRFWRLTPPYMLIMMVQICISKYLGSGPMWLTNGFEKKYCKDTWWWNLLYINNFKTAAEECFGHAWYLANDMQFYVISPPILLALHHGGDYFDAYYQMPYCRIGPYLVGMYTGYILYTTKCKCKINKFVNITIWAVFAASALAVLYGIYDDINGDQLSTGVAALYNVLHKTVWGAAVCWVIFACATGNGGFVNTILSWKGFVPLSRLTYCAYLIHPLVMYCYYKSRKQLLFWDDHEVIYEFFAHLGMAYAVAFVASLVFESPMMGLEKVVFRKDKKK
ncbi:nose resistant to fluoxetine protein 6-like [Mytilus californianus]|uniref:nose resistant to fluoxetine protein 6-like n=1 Tax=Mytilus californianus TaxID=6549 RepID=UPI002246C8F2|nr:nose resistant to fluoxetine protein 6-like [Mytilus californianus]